MNLICDKCRKKDKSYKYRWVYREGFLCSKCYERPESVSMFTVIPTVNYKEYKKNNGNVSANRIKSIRSRDLNPEGEVVMVRAGKLTDKLAEG